MINKFKKLMACAVLSAVCLTALLPSKAYASTYTAAKVYCVALGMPYHYTVSVQNNSLVISGQAPSYLDNGTFTVDLIEPVSYKNQSIDSNGLAIMERRIVDLSTADIQKQLHPTVMGSVTRQLTASSHIAPEITVTGANGKSSLALDYANVPKIALSGLSDGLYNIRTKFSGNWADCAYLYCDDIVVVMQGGQGSLQVIPTYFRGTYFGNGCMTYDGYTLDPHAMDPAITEADEGSWMKSHYFKALSE